MTAPAVIPSYYDAYGAAWAIQVCDAPEVMVSGPAGTGKSRAILEKINYQCENYPGARILMVRKTRRSLTESGMVTLAKRVLLASQRVQFHHQSQQYRYPNGSVIAVGGLDKPSKIMSSEWDVIYVQEATEITLDDWESCIARTTRPGMTARLPYSQVIGDCNPDAPQHWIRQRIDRGALVELLSKHEDNPLLYDHAGQIWTPEGERYLAVLDSLTGVRYSRLRLGQWVAAEGMVYQDTWDRGVNLIDRFPIPAEWPRFLSIDFGFTNPFVCQWWASDPDGRLYRYREIYQTQLLVEDAARQIREWSGWDREHGEPLPYAVICDHDAEDRATLRRHLRLPTVAAQKGVSIGIQNVAARLRPAGDGKPRLMLMRDSLVHRDPNLAAAKKPTCTEEEVESYVWNEAKDQPIKEDDHGMDCTRYCVMHLDGKPNTVTYAPSVWED